MVIEFTKICRDKVISDQKSNLKNSINNRCGDNTVFKFVRNNEPFNKWY